MLAALLIPAELASSRVVRHVQMRQLDQSKFEKFTRSIRQKEFQIVKEQRRQANARQPKLVVIQRWQPKKWWSQAGSNRRPPACKAGALPAELWPQLWWVWEDLNFRPHPYQGCALTN